MAAKKTSKAATKPSTEDTEAVEERFKATDQARPPKIVKAHFRSPLPNSKGIRPKQAVAAAQGVTLSAGTFQGEPMLFVRSEKFPGEAIATPWANVAGLVLDESDG